MQMDSMFPEGTILEGIRVKMLLYIIAALLIDATFLTPKHIIENL
jgi:hypothetical protein